MIRFVLVLCVLTVAASQGPPIPTGEPVPTNTPTPTEPTEPKPTEPTTAEPPTPREYFSTRKWRGIHVTECDCYICLNSPLF